MDAWLAMATRMQQWDYICFDRSEFSFEMTSLQSREVKYVYKDINHKFSAQYIGNESDILLSYVEGFVSYGVGAKKFFPISGMCMLYDLKHAEVCLSVDVIRVYSVEISRQNIVNYLQTMFFCQIEDLRFLEAIIDADVPRRIIKDLLLSVHAYIVRNPEVAALPVIMAQFDQLVISTLLQCTRHTCRHLFDLPQRSDLPHLVTQVEAFLEAHAHTPVTIADLARLTGRSGRTIQATFKKYRDYSPSDFLKECRLQNARRMLLATELSVTSVALQCGFSSVSHFARYYRQRFGENPSGARKIVSVGLPRLLH